MGACDKEAKAASIDGCGLLTDIFWGCDVALQDLRQEEQRTQQVLLDSNAQIQVAEANKAVLEAQARAEALRAQYEKEGSVDVANAYAKAQVLVAEAQERAQIVMAQEAGYAQVEVKRIETDGAVLLALLPWAFGATILIAIMYVVYLILSKRWETDVEMAKVNVLPVERPQLNDWQTACLVRAKQRNMQWRTVDEYGNETDEFYVVSNGVWKMVPRPPQLTSNGGRA
jgi:hypothetical protein